MTHWFCYRVAPQKEFALELALRSRGLNAYVPTEKRVLFRRQAGAKKQQEKLYPLLVGYIFVGFQDKSDWPVPIHRFDAIKSAVSCAGGAACFSDAAIQNLKDLASRSVAHTLSRPTRRSFAAGEMVTVVRGPARDPRHKVKIERIKGRKATLILQWLGAEREIDVPLEALEAA